MSVASQDVYLNLNTPVSVVGSGGGGPVSPDLLVSTLTAANYISSPQLIVSSINGAAYNPGGAVPANLVVSTISTAGNVAFGADVNIVGRVTQGSTFMQSAGLNLVNLSIDAPFGTLSMTNVSTIYTSPEVSMSGDLSVSSINGSHVAAPAIKIPGYSFTIGAFSTNVGPIFPNDLSNRLFTISTIAGHSYRLDLTTQLRPAQPSIDPASVPLSNSIIVYINTGANTLYTDSIPTADVYNISRGPLSSFNAAYSVPFVAAGAAASAYIGYSNNDGIPPTAFTNTTLVSSIGPCYVTDLGAI